MADQEQKKPISKEVPQVQCPLEWKDFLESHPPGKTLPIVKLAYAEGGHFYLCKPELELYCDNQSCKGMRFFECVSGYHCLERNKWNEDFVTYRCKNCEETSKRFAIAVRISEGSLDGQAFKLGEMPPFGPPLPSRVIDLVGPDRELFLAGRRAESQGMGIGTFAYYRRVVENQKNRILDEIIKVSERIGAKPEAIEALKKAQIETQFSKAVTSVKDAIPQVLLIDGRNPVTLLHSALSEGLHARTDEECLDLASAIRVVLTELADRIGQALKDEAQLKEAVKRLLQAKSFKDNETNPEV